MSPGRFISGRKASPESSDAVTSRCAAKQSVANNSVLEAQDVPLSQDSDGYSDNGQALLTQVAAESGSEEEDDDGDMESEAFQSLSPNVTTGSVNHQSTTSPATRQSQNDIGDSGQALLTQAHADSFSDDDDEDMESEAFQSLSPNVTTGSVNQESTTSPATQDSQDDVDSTGQPLLTQAPVESFSDDEEEDENDDRKHSLTPNVSTASVNQHLATTPTPPATQESQQAVDSSSDELQAQSPAESANHNSATTTPESHNSNNSRFVHGRRRRNTAGWVRPELLSTTTKSTTATKRDNVESTLVVEEKKLPDSPAFGWPTHVMGAQQQQHSVTNNSAIAASSPKSSAQSDSTGSPPQYATIGHPFYLTQPPGSADSKQQQDDCSGGFANTSPETTPSPRKQQPPDSIRKEAILATPLPQQGSSPNSQSSGGFNGMLDSSPEGEQPSPQDVARTPTTTTTTPMHGSDLNTQNENEMSSSEDDDNDVEEKKDLTREERIQRNNKHLVSLGLLPPEMAQTPVCAGTPSPGGKFDAVKSPTGMLFVSPSTNETSTSSTEGAPPEDRVSAALESANIDELYERYPHRQTQIRTLVSLIGTTMGQTEYQGNTPYVPSPIFVSGPSGSGKTSIVRDTVETLQRHYSSSLTEGRVIGTAYVNCAAIEPSSLEAVLESAYSQLVPSEVSRRPKQAKRPTKRKRKAEAAPSDEPSVKHLKADTISDGVAVFDARLPSEDADVGIRSNDGDYNSDNESEMEDMMEESKAHLSQIESDERKSSGSVDSPPSRRITRHSMNATAVGNRRGSDTSVPNAQKKTIRKSESITKSHGAPVAFGRVISPFFGPRSPLAPETKPGSAFLILDHAERLFTLSASQRAEPNNFLAQLLLLPQVMGLNLTVVIVSRSALLDCSRINNSASIQKALGTITNGIRPVRVNFPAYRGNAEFKAILKQPGIVELIVGRQSPFSESNDDSRRKFQESTIDSFIDTVVQSLSSITRDTREMIRVGRALWSTYTLPLDPRNIRATLDAARRRRSEGRSTTLESVLIGGNTAQLQENANVEDLQKEILAILDEAMLPRMKKCLEEELFTMKGDDTHATAGNTLSGASSSQYDLPFLSKCLLLAAFVCQSNKPDKDKALFTIQRNGKKNNRQGHRVGNNDAEGLAFGSTTWEQQRLKMLRPRTFPLERMLSVFVNIVGLIGGEEKLRCSVNSSADTRDLLSSIGSTCFFENLARLREIGILHEVQGPSTGGGDGFSSFDGVNLLTTKYWCELNRDDAEALAASVDFELANFLV